MAEATKDVKVITTRVESVSLSLSIQEAEFLASLLGHVAGSETNSPRKHQRAISKALGAAGVASTDGGLYGAGTFLRAEVFADMRRHVANLYDPRYVGEGVRYKDYPRDWSESERG